MRDDKQENEDEDVDEVEDEEEEGGEEKGEDEDKCLRLRLLGFLRRSIAALALGELLVVGRKGGLGGDIELVFHHFDLAVMAIRMLER